MERPAGGNLMMIYKYNSVICFHFEVSVKLKKLKKIFSEIEKNKKLVGSIVQLDHSSIFRNLLFSCRIII